MTDEPCIHGTPMSVRRLDGCGDCIREERAAAYAASNAICAENTRRERIIAMAASLVAEFTSRSVTGEEQEIIDAAFVLAEDFEKRAAAYRETGK